MTALRILALSLATLVIVVVPADAQRGRGGQRGPGGRGLGFGPGGGGITQVIGNPAVHEELQLSNEQSETLQTLTQEIRQSMFQNFQELQELEPQERAARFREIQEANEKRVREELQSVLDEEQIARVHQIALQISGVRAFASPEVQEKLGLSEDQKLQMEQVATELTRETRELMANARGNPGAGRQVFQQVRELQETAMNQALKALTEEQRSTWNAMIGEPFEMPARGPGRGGRGGRRPGGPPTF